MRGISLIRLNPRRCTNRKQALNSSPIHMRYILGMPGRCVDGYLFIYLFIYLHRHGNVALLDKQGHKKNHNDAAKIKAGFN